MNSRLKELRTELNITVRELAEALNLTAGSISLIENGKRNITDRTIADLERLYNVNTDWIRTGEGNMFKERTREIEIAEITAAMYKTKDTDFRYQLIKLIAEMSPEQIELLREVAETLQANIKEAENKEV